MNWDELTEEQQNYYRRGLIDNVDNNVIETTKILDELTAFYWMGYRDMDEWRENFGIDYFNIPTSKRILEHCN